VSVEVALPSDERTRQPTPDADLAGRRVLIVDDNLTAQRITSAYARGWGMDTVSVGSPANALALLRGGERFDLGLLDFEMPGSTCVDLVRAIRDTRPGSTLPLIVLSSAAAGRDELAQLADQRVPVHQKPIKRASLHTAIASVLGGQSGRRRAAVTPLDPATASGFPLRILIVEDQELNQRVLTLMLERLGYQPHLASNGREALARIALEPYDLVLMDIQMPELDGFETTRRIRAANHATTRIVGVSAHASEDVRTACLESGMDGYLTKPLTTERLIDVLTKAAC
jgi:CheY-like chemotaxis protein